MRTATLRFLLVFILSLALNGCRPAPSPTTTAFTSTPKPGLPTQIPMLQGEAILVTSNADSGLGSLRQALEDAQPYDEILFDPDVFPPGAPITISPSSDLPQITQGYLTIDASNAGVILDGNQLPSDTWIPGLEIVSDGNTIRGLQVTNFTGTGIVVAQGRDNTIGGERSIGVGPTGQGNLSSGNDFGIGLWDFAVNNLVTGNLVGTDLSGKRDFGNLSSGVWITEGGMGNVVGPDNIIAFNGRYGVEVQESTSLHNTITRNSIHDNQTAGIGLVSGGNNALEAPTVFDIDFNDGSIAGNTCAGCTVEIFSDKGDQGTIYEGQSVTDSNGRFVFRKGSWFSNSHITLTATDSHGNTSEFSTPTIDPRESLTLQEGNNLPKNEIVTEYFGRHPNNWIGDMFPLDRHPKPCPTATQDWSYTHVGDLGLKWVRLSLDFTDLESVREYDNYSQFEVNECQEQVLNLLVENDIAILYTLVYWDEELHAEVYPDYGNEDDIQRFVDYSRFIVRHFKDRIQYYEILNEAIAYVDVTDYINLVHRVVPVIRDEDPQAKIVVGDSANLLYPHTQDYLFTVLQSDIIPIVDGIAAHPMYGSSPQYEETRSYYYNYPNMWQDIKDVAVAHGFSGEYFAEEMAWRTSINPLPEWEPWVYTPIVAAKYYARGILINRGLDIWAGIGGEMYDTILPIPKVVRNLGTVMAGAVPATLDVEIQGEAMNVVSYTFSSSNGDRLVAFWMDGEAVDDDPGVPTTLIFPGLSAQNVVGIDVLEGFRQELVTGTENG
jgi:hypothetical protein